MQFYNAINQKFQKRCELQNVSSVNVNQPCMIEVKTQHIYVPLLIRIEITEIPFRGRYYNKGISDFKGRWDVESHSWFISTRYYVNCSKIVSISDRELMVTEDEIIRVCKKNSVVDIILSRTSKFLFCNN